MRPMKVNSQEIIREERRETKRETKRERGGRGFEQKKRDCKKGTFIPPPSIYLYGKNHTTNNLLRGIYAIFHGIFHAFNNED